MYTRYNILKYINISNLIKSKRYFSSSINENIFFDLTIDYNRKRFIHSDLLSNAIQNINTNISEKHSLLILTAAARFVHHVTPEKRIELLEEAWKKLNEKKIRLTTRHYETYLSGLNENGFLFDSDYYFNLINTEQIQPTPRLYSLLLNQYCREGNLKGAEKFLQILKERHINLDENMFSALIVCQLKLGNTKNAQDIIQLMKERGLPPTITTYKEILTILISEHKFEEFQKYFSQIKPEKNLISTLYIDKQFILILLGQCILYKDEIIFKYLLDNLKNLNEKSIGYNLFNLSIQCLENQWFEYSIELLDIKENNIYEKNSMNFLKYLFDNQKIDLIEKFIELMRKKNLSPLDLILRVFYTNKYDDYRSILNYLEQGKKFQHPMRINYFYPLLLNAYSNKYWTENDYLRLFNLLDPLAYQIETFTYSNLLQQSFHQYYQNDFHSLLNLLDKNNLQAICDRICRLILHDIKHQLLDLNIIKQITPYFRLHNHTRQEELARYLFSIMIDIPSISNIDENSSSISINDFNSIFNLIDTISKNLSNDIPLLKHELYLYLFGFSVENHRKDLTIRLAEQCIKENMKFDSSIHEINSLTNHLLSSDIVEQLSRYKPNELSWKEKLSKIVLTKTNRSKLEEIYSEAKQNERYPLIIQQRLLDIYIQKKLPNQAFKILQEIISNQHKINILTYHRLFNLVTVKLDTTVENLKTINLENIKYLSDLYEKSFDLKNLPNELTFRLAHIYLHNNDEKTALKLIKNKIELNLNNEIFQYFIKFFQINSSLLSIDGLNSIGYLLLNYRPNELIRRFWNHFFDILLNKTTPIDIVQFYSEAMKKNSQIPYLHLFQLFIEKDELNRLQDIVDIATVHHGSHNILLDLAFILLKNEKLKQAERILQTSWLKARNDRINLHALLFADSNNLNALINGIKLTKTLPGINQKQLFTSAIRVAIRLDKSDIVNWLVEEIENNKIQIDIRVKKFLDAHLLSKGLNRLNLEINEQEKLNLSDQEQYDISI